MSIQSWWEVEWRLTGVTLVQWSGNVNRGLMMSASTTGRTLDLSYPRFMWFLGRVYLARRRRRAAMPAARAVRL